MLTKIFGVVFFIAIINCEKPSQSHSFSISIKHDPSKKQNFHSFNHAALDSNAYSHSGTFENLGNDKITNDLSGKHREPAPIYEKLPVNHQQKGPALKPTGNTQQFISNGYAIEAQIAQSVKQQGSAFGKQQQFNYKNLYKDQNIHNQKARLDVKQTDVSIEGENNQSNKKEQTTSFKNVVFHNIENNHKENIQEGFADQSSYIQKNNYGHFGFSENQENQRKQGGFSSHNYKIKDDHSTFDFGEANLFHEKVNSEEESHAHLSSLGNDLKHVIKNNYELQDKSISLGHSGHSLSSQRIENNYKLNHLVDLDNHSHSSGQANGHAYSSQSFVLHSGGHSFNEENHHESSHDNENSHKSHSNSNKHEHNDSFDINFSSNEAKKHSAEEIFSNAYKSHGSVQESENKISTSFDFVDQDSSNHDSSSLQHGQFSSLESLNHHSTLPQYSTHHESSQNQQGGFEHEQQHYQIYENAQSSLNSGYHYHVPQTLFEHKNDLGEQKKSFSDISGHKHKFETHHIPSKHIESSSNIGHKDLNENTVHNYHTPQYETNHHSSGHKSAFNEQNYHHHLHKSGHKDGIFEHANSFSGDSSDHHYDIHQFDTKSLLSGNQQSSFENDHGLSLVTSSDQYQIPEYKTLHKLTGHEQDSTEYRSLGSSESSSHKHQDDHTVSEHGATSSYGHGFLFENIPHHETRHDSTLGKEKDFNEHVSSFSFVPEYETHNEFSSYGQSSPKLNHGIYFENYEYHYPSSHEKHENILSKQSHSSAFGSSEGETKYALHNFPGYDKSSSEHGSSFETLGFHHPTTQEEHHTSSEYGETFGHGKLSSFESLGQEEKSSDFGHEFSVGSTSHDKDSQHKYHHESSGLASHGRTLLSQSLDHSRDNSHHHNDDHQLSSQQQYYSSSNQDGHNAQSYSEHHYLYPKYEYSFEVQDPHSKDLKKKYEIRDGDNVKGAYTVHDADGSIRTVEYYADKHTGFNAQIKKMEKKQESFQHSHHHRT